MPPSLPLTAFGGNNPNAAFRSDREAISSKLLKKTCPARACAAISTTVLGPELDRRLVVESGYWFSFGWRSASSSSISRRDGGSGLVAAETLKPAESKSSAIYRSQVR